MVFPVDVGNAAMKACGGGMEARMVLETDDKDQSYLYCSRDQAKTRAYMSPDFTC